jgi:Ca2+-transporting ATPase
MEVHQKSIQESADALQSDVQNGLSQSEAVTRLEKYGPNVLKEKPKKSNLVRFFEQFKDPMILILLGAALVSFIMSIVEKEGIKSFFEPALILAIVIMNAVMGVMQENKAEKALEALKSLSAPHARVIRDGKETLVEASNLVPGDLIRLEAGDFVPADARLISSASLKSEESALTGESVPSEKEATALIEEKAPLGDRKNMIFSGCSITYGTGTALVSATGMDSEMGKIANLLNNEEEGMTPLQAKLNQLGKYLGILALGCCAIVFVVGILDGLDVMEIFMTSVSLAVSAIPEGLPAIVTIVLSMGVTRMVKKNAIIRKLPAVETLGSASVICSDKTGTLTQNKMTLVQAYEDGKDIAEKISTQNSQGVKELLRYGTLCSNGTIDWKEGKEVHIGDPTETSIVKAAMENGMDQKELNVTYPRLAELPFDSDRKRMSVITQENGKPVLIVKGAFDEMLDKITHGDKEKAKKINDEMSQDALRVIAIAKKELDTVPESLGPEDLEKDLTFLGMVGMIDPPRPEAKEAVAAAKKAGITPVMITGDHVQTASAIAKQIGILQPGQKAITGKELDAMSDQELDNQVDKIGVYARVSPENKIRIVKSWQRKGDVVAMTGDGVNDAPALKAADIGAAMGITGTDVAKSAADMTLTDDNFATIIAAVKEGRGIYNNIKNVVGYLLGTNIGEVVCVFMVMLLWKESALLSMQLLWVNLVTDSLPAVALGMEPVDESVMSAKPKPKNESLFAHGFGVRIVLMGIMFGVLPMIGFKAAYIQTAHLESAQTLAFMVLALSQVVQSYNMRSEKSLLKIGFFSNKKLNGACLLSLVLVLFVLFTPGVMSAFGFVYLSAKLYLLGLVLVLVPLVIMEFSKAFGLIKHQK